MVDDGRREMIRDSTRMMDLPSHNPYCRPNEFFIFSTHVFMNFHVNIDISLHFQYYQKEAKAREKETELFLI